MKRLITAGNIYLDRMNLTDIALLKICVGALGVIFGLILAPKHRKGAGIFAGFLFALTWVPLMGRFFSALLTAQEEEY